VTDDSRPAGSHEKVRRRVPRILLFAFAFAVMADPVSSVTYAPEAALRALRNDISLLIPAMLVVLAIILLVRVNYHQLIRRFPQGGGAVAATAAALGETWAFVPLGALVVDFVLTISISVAAASSAIIAYFPKLAPMRIPIAVGLCVAVAGLTWFGHIGRSVFATMTITFAVVAVPTFLIGFISPHGVPPPQAPPGGPVHFPVLLVLFAFPVAMASATGIEGMSSSIAQLGQLDDAGRIRTGHVTSWLTMVIQGTLTFLIAFLALHLSIGVPRANSTLVANLARASAGHGALFAAFQFASMLVLLAAASSSFQAGPGLLKAMARKPAAPPRSAEAGADAKVGILPEPFSSVNRHHTPYWGVVLFLVISSAVVIAAGGKDQSLALFYAVAVFVSFLTGLMAMALFSRRSGDARSVALNLIGAALVLFTIFVNLSRGYPIASIAAALGVGGLFALMWIKQGRPRGIAQIEAEGEREAGDITQPP
jgi:amino acid transporter